MSRGVFVACWLVRRFPLAIQLGLIYTPDRGWEGVLTAPAPLLRGRRTQEIGDAAQFLGFAGIIVPSARWSGSNLVLFTDRLEPDTLAVLTQEPIDWAAEVA